MLFARLGRQLPYIAGLALDLVGFVASPVALRELPLFVVQAAIGDRTRAHFEIVAVSGFVLAVGASLALARYTEPVMLLEKEPEPTTR